MATANIPTETESFDDQLSQIRIEIERYFLLLLNSLKKRERELLTELEEITSRHKREKEQHKQSLSEIEFMLKQAQENIHSNVLKETQTGIVKMLEQQQREIKSKLSSKRLLFDFDDTLLDRINCFATVTVVNSNLSTLPFVDYKNKVKPILSVGGSGKTEGQFNLPWGVETDKKTDNIYVVDRCNSRVQVFDKAGKYLSQFKTGELEEPICIAISKDILLISKERHKSLLVYDLNGYFIKEICKSGDGKKCLSEPFGIAIDEVTGDIYVCDCTDCCVKIFAKDYSYKTEFGNGITFLRDIKLTKNNIYLVSNKSPFLYIFNLDLTQVNSAIVSDSISQHLNTPNSFVIDEAGNFIFPSYSNNNITIFDKQGRLIHKITDSISKPVGLTLDSKGRVIVVGHNNRILIF